MVPQQESSGCDPSFISSMRALNSIFSKWKIEAEPTQWNKSGELCSGAATDSTDLSDLSYNPFIKCDCSYNDGSLCHITQLKVTVLDVAGPIPEEIWTLTYLIHLNLNQNYLTGSIPPSIGNLTKMKYLSLAANGLSGEIPKEIGKLTELLSLSLLRNNFSGSVPSEFGNFSQLKELYIGSSGISGPIPSTFANLRNLAVVWASDLELTGRIPDFIGNWTKLTTLRLQGNSFEGPIPTTFSNLTSLEELRLGDITNGSSSSLSFIKDMKSLNLLVLRNIRISDSIPANIGEYENLAHLDLSFNNIIGQIPDSLFNMSSLSFLFLGNNKLNGTLPQQKSRYLLTIDLSYNNLRGSLPSWVNEEKLQLNLVGNNFTIESLNSSALPSGLNCVQRNFPCNSGRGIYYDFSIKCGGPQITSSDAIVYESDNEPLGPATYFVSGTRRWAVSSVGYFVGSTNPKYTSSAPSRFTNTLDSQLFETARLSASSLRYYGLGLENGNYNVILQFAETAFEDSLTWTSHGRRVFDIYIQGNLVLKDFDIRKEAGGVSLRAIRRDFKAYVSQNYLEIHLFWAGKGTCCIPDLNTYGPSISAISATPDFKPTVNNKPPTNKKNRTGQTVGIAVGVSIFSFLFVLVAFYIVKRRKKCRTSKDEELLGIDIRPLTFSYAELSAATNDFSSANKLGEGGFGPVYKGMLDDGRTIAVKQLSLTSQQGNNQFVTEIATISAVQHRNLVKLYGWCLEGERRLLIYEYLENKSLDLALFGKNNLKLNWSTRFDICLGVARGLAYLHEESRLPIVHRDVKASNILLDSNLIPKISDFGLAKLFDDKMTHISTRIAGTIGYLSPEYAMRGHLTKKTDVFAFGILALEIVSGRRISDSNLEGKKIYLLEWAWNLYEQDCESELVDSELSEIDDEEVRRVVGVALLCTQTLPTARPSMSRVVAMLSGDLEVNREISRPGYLVDWTSDSISSLTDIETKEIKTSSSYRSITNTGMEGDP
ncbi:hypothetical protein TIFTF001_016133 [Ficus carica]|uniref:non-specific serine/threonine protein kinase n=1 Tax=Ficus carica TaxID=3494 RepID=A0AA88A8F0_FICCA|nr:hypothetical protein TIFTF001_016133 [Ficus carica]